MVYPMALLLDHSMVVLMGKLTDYKMAGKMAE